jgi:hypothetical protein
MAAITGWLPAKAATPEERCTPKTEKFEAAPADVPVKFPHNLTRARQTYAVNHGK